ncbi:DDE superfamily endonuclease containing protein [Histomonas meleagridis]|uniref:DDE superfamily endonuclease containing protein n=1 Tax=Histomonas meleagridis TaxID=135588 RepID=UPI0035596790|nr:DDE superfamily endonuclease containing protein [Histomonas meleagridis]
MHSNIFPGKPHKDYTNYKKRPMLECVITQISRGYPRISKIAQTSKIPDSTLRSWKDKLKHNPAWRPWNNDHGSGHRIFTDIEEQSIKDFIVDCFLQPSFVFTNEDFIIIAMNAYLTKYQDITNFKETKDFLVSHQFIADFKKRNHLSSRVLHPKRRPNVTDKEKSNWIDTIQNLLTSVDHSRIVNVNETCWKCFPNGMVTWAEKRSDGISINLNSSPKASITVLASIRSDGTKIPLYFIAKGKSDLVETTQIGDVSPHMSTHSENGWTTEETFYEYLLFLRQHFNDEDPIHLLLDSYKAHKCQSIIDLAETLKIKLYFIPPGMTDEFQPLDRRVFGCLKATARYLFRKEYNQNNEKKFTKLQAQCMVWAWEHLQPNIIQESWSIYE